MLKSFLQKKFGKQKIDGTFIPLFFARDCDDFGIGDINSLIKSVDLLNLLNQNVLEILPINFSSAFESPYSVLSSRCFNTIYISIKHMLEIIPSLDAKNFIKNNNLEIQNLKSLDRVDYPKVKEIKNSIYKIIYNDFVKMHDKKNLESLNKFKKDNESWLNDHLLYIILRNKFMLENPKTGWDFRTWPEDIKIRDKETINNLKAKYNEELQYQIFLQWIFYKQWKSLQTYADSKKVAIMGDIPYAVDGADIWIQPEIFGLTPPFFKRTFTQGVPSDYFTFWGQYWQFYPYDFNNPNTLKFLTDRIEWNQDLFSIIRLDHVLGYYRSYMFFEDPNSKATLKNLGIYDQLKELADSGKHNPHQAGHFAWEAYKLILHAIKHKRLNFSETIIEELFTENDFYKLKENNMILIAKELDQNTSQTDNNWLRQFCVESAIFNDKPIYYFQKISNDKTYYQDHERLSEYLYSHDKFKFNPNDSIRPCFFKHFDGETIMKAFLKQAESKDTILIMESLGIVPNYVTDSLNNMKAINYIPLIFGITPYDKGNPYFEPNHVENAFVTFSLHDTETLYNWWNQKSMQDKQVILNYLFEDDVEKASNYSVINEKLQVALLSKIYSSKARIKVLLLQDILLLDDNYAINKPGNQMGQWVARMPKCANLDDLILSAKNEPSTELADYGIKVFKKIKC